MNFFKKLKISLCAGLIISIIFSVVSFGKTADRIDDEILRLHILANSDSIEDQHLKIKVRDAVIKESENIFNGIVNIDNAISKITPEITNIQMTAEKVIYDNGYNYKVKVYLKNEYFTTRTYDDVTLPAGNYLALKIIIGNGKGHNWWCVMFPPMCLPAADKKDVLSDVLNQKEINLVERNPKYEIRFKIIEMYESMKKRININK